MADILTPLMVDAAEAARLIGVSKATWNRWDSAGRIPAPVRLSPGCVRWRVSELTTWIAAGCPRRTDWQERGEATP
jgi:prophage regulatory protein